ncbi:hypothetical protein QYF61_016712 [Mycteria americana]|uniref:Uncharacterized protein n=1 Tax=Mycteria americana TaxID=33587 RepID=A0AAN7RU02_MYCAM|nr:hypothetical protein QYF61_016712 [Mycteria americana]
MQPRTWLVFWAVSAHCWLMSSFSSSSIPKSTSTGLLSIPSSPSLVLILRVAPTQVQDLVLGLVEPHEVHMGPLLKLVQVPLDDIPSLRYVNNTTQIGVIFKFAESFTRSFCLSLMKILNSTGPSADPRGTPLVTDLHLDTELLTTTLWIRRDFAHPVPALRSIHSRVRLPLHLGLPDPIPTQPGSIPILFPGYLSLLPLPGPDFTLRLSRFPQDCELHQCMITAAQAAFNLDVSFPTPCSQYFYFKKKQQFGQFGIFSTEPWGTPLVTGCQLDLTPFTTTLWAQPSSQHFTQQRVHPSKP